MVVVLKKDFGDLRRKQEAWLDEYPYQHFRGSSTLTSFKDCSQDLASGLKLNFCFSGRMKHVVIGESCMKSMSCSWVRRVAGNQIERQEDLGSTVTPRKTAAR